MGVYFGETQPGGGERILPPSADGEIPAELEFFDSIAREPARLSGAKITLHVLNVAANHHPLYSEASEDGQWQFPETYTVPAGLEFNRPDDIMTEVGPSGKKKNKEAILWVARCELEEVGAPEPKPGDVVEFWGYAPFGDDYRHSFWDVVGADPSGEHMSQPTYTMLKFKLQWHERFLAERKDRTP